MHPLPHMRGREKLPTNRLTLPEVWCGQVEVLDAVLFSKGLRHRRGVVQILFLRDLDGVLDFLVRIVIYKLRCLAEVGRPNPGPFQQAVSVGPDGPVVDHLKRLPRQDELAARHAEPLQGGLLAGTSSHFERREK